MTPTEQELACIHADALLVQQRLELSAGLQEVCAETAAKQQQMVASTIRRDKQSKIFGTRTMKEKRMDELAIEVAGRTPSNAAVGATIAAHFPAAGTPCQAPQHLGAQQDHVSLPLHQHPLICVLARLPMSYHSAIL